MDAIDTAVNTSNRKSSFTLYIDADNQSPQCAKELLNVLLGDCCFNHASAVIAGNNQGQQIDHWHRELTSILPTLDASKFVAPLRKQGADIILLMNLGANLERHIRERELIVIVSRDDLLIGAAEHAKSLGGKAVIAYADSDLRTARNTKLLTLLLPVVAKLPVVVPQTTTSSPPAAEAKPIPTKQFTNDTVATVIAELRKMCKKKPNGGYVPTEIGQALQKLGYDKAARARLLKSVPNIQVLGVGANKTIVF